MDKILVSGMEFFGYHGVLPEETRLGQRFIVDIGLGLSLRPAGLSDDLDKTINYALVYQVAKEIVEGPPVKLIETVAERIAETLLDQFALLDNVQVSIIKPGAPIAGVFRDVRIIIERQRRGYVDIAEAEVGKQLLP